MLYYNQKETRTKQKQKEITKMTTLRTADFDTYCAIEDYVFSILADDEATLTLADAQAFAASLGVTLTEWDLTSLTIDFDEM